MSNIFYIHPEKQGIMGWPGAVTECQSYVNKALSLFFKDADKGMFFLGAALHLVQDVCVPHHALGVVFDGHKNLKLGRPKTVMPSRQNVDCIWSFLTQPNGLSIMPVIPDLYIPWFP